MSQTVRKSVDRVQRGQRLAKSGKLPRDGGSRRSDLVRAIAQDLADEVDSSDMICDHLYECNCYEEMLLREMRL